MGRRTCKLVSAVVAGSRGGMLVSQPFCLGNGTTLAFDGGLAHAGLLALMCAAVAGAAMHAGTAGRYVLLQSLASLRGTAGAKPCVMHGACTGQKG